VTNPLVDTKGRALGVKALKRRREIFDACARMIQDDAKYRDITPTRVMVIARFGTCRSTASGAFYQYWHSVDELIEEIYQELHEKEDVSDHLYYMRSLIWWEKMYAKSS
jgi:hypothetical protein